ncbi:VOC family protein [Numidum massiliense]|uniref:VOC family protein n=1 Tax=Numidum massiliense TaxID=1522315 RepID=UPI0006D5A068|nr:VOC family protein [Numidum massiliense]
MEKGTLVLDHVVHFINPTRSTELLAELAQNGFHAVAGGQHVNWGTYNVLSYFDLSYIEWLAVERIEIAGRVIDNPLVGQLLHDLPRGEGLGQLAIRTGDIERLAAHIERTGTRVTLTDGSRTRADGKTLAWRMLFVDGPFEALPLPFFIQWGQSDEERRTDLQMNGTIAPHSAGNLRLKEVFYAAHDPGQTAAHWQRLFGLPSGGEAFNAELGAHCHRLRLGDVDIVFCRPERLQRPHHSERAQQSDHVLHQDRAHHMDRRSQSNRSSRSGHLDRSEAGDIVGQTLLERGERPFTLTLTGAKRRAEVQFRGSVYHLEP